MRHIILFFVIALLGAGCAAAPSQTASVKAPSTESAEPAVPVQNNEAQHVEMSVAFPVEEYVERRTLKAFGEYISDRFNGYHVGDDIEFTDRADRVPVYAIADGTVLEKKDFVSGYGGVMRIRHDVNGETVTAIYGHLDFADVEIAEGDRVAKGDLIAHLGEQGPATDGERKHLHFGLYANAARRINGYEATRDGVRNWLNPSRFFTEQGLEARGRERAFDPAAEPGSAFAELSFTVPAGMEIEYVPAIQSLNVFSVMGDGSARERSQIFIRYFDASDFLTLNSVTIHQTEDLTVGGENYPARRYDIEKKSGFADFPEQPAWRNERHIVTDTRKSSGLARYFVIAKNPDLDMRVYEQFLDGVELK